MRSDPEGHYATLGLDPAASAEAVATAFRAAARRLHPDIPETGDAAAFIRAREAYDVLGHPDRRAAYDRTAHTGMDTEFEGGFEEDGPMPETGEAAIPAEAWQRPPGLPFGLWAGGAALALVALAIGFASLGRDRPPPRPVALKPEASAPTPPRLPVAPAAPVLQTPAEAYILPGGDLATLWHRDPQASRYVPAGSLPAFAAVTVRGVNAEHGMAEVRAGDNRQGFVYASRVAPGDAAAAERARCIYEAGAPPANNDILARRGSGPAQVQVENRRDQPAVVKLRNTAGTAAAEVFIAPRGTVTVGGLPADAYRPEWAYGDLWSHGCKRFVAGMRAQRFAAFEQVGQTGPAPTRYTIPFDDGVDETDDEFNR